MAKATISQFALDRLIMSSLTLSVLTVELSAVSRTAAELGADDHKHQEDKADGQNSNSADGIKPRTAKIHFRGGLTGTAHIHQELQVIIARGVLPFRG